MTALQSVVSRAISPFDTAVVSVTQIHGGDAYNIIPEDVQIRGNCRAYRSEVMDRIEATIQRIAENTAAAHGATARLNFRRSYPPLVNHARETEIACDAAALVVGEPNVDRNGAPRMASEDFSYMLEKVPGAMVMLGNGGTEAINLHNSRYDFNDMAIPFGISFFVKTVERFLGDRQG